MNTKSHNFKPMITMRSLLLMSVTFAKIAILLLFTNLVISFSSSAADTALNQKIGDPDDGKPGSWESRKSTLGITHGQSPEEEMFRKDEELKKLGPFPQEASKQALTEVVFSEHGNEVNGLQFSLAADTGVYQYGSQMKLHLRLKNFNSSDMDIPEMKGGETLETCSTLRFRVVSDKGDEIEVVNSYPSSKIETLLVPLHIQGNGELIAAFELDDIMSSNGRLFEMYKKASILTFGVVVNGSNLASNLMTIPVQAP